MLTNTHTVATGGKRSVQCMCPGVRSKLVGYCRRDIPAHPSTHLPDNWGHLGLLHGLGTHPRTRGPGVHCGELVCVYAYVCVPAYDCVFCHVYTCVYVRVFACV